MDFTAFREMKPFPQLMFGLFIMVCSGIILSIVSIIISIPFFGMKIIISSLSIDGLNSPENIYFLKYFQVVQSITVFVIPPIILGSLYHGNIPEYLQINRTTRWQTYLMASCSLLLIIPFINFLGDINQLMRLPEFLSGIEQKMKNWEDMAKVAIEKFMDVKSIYGLLFNVFMIAVLPAIGEEFMFRGFIQGIFTKMTKNYHWGIWIAAIIFSAIHLQFYGFLPRMVLGAMFGYLLVWTGTMWVPILAHFVNNAMDVIGYYLINKGVITKDVEEWGTGNGQFPLVIFSVIAVSYLLYLVYRYEQGKTKMPANQFDSQASRID